MLSPGLSYVRHLKTVRTHLLWLVHHSKINSEENGVDYTQGLTEQVWRNMCHKGQVSTLDIYSHCRLYFCHSLESSFCSSAREEHGLISQTAAGNQAYSRYSSLLTIITALWIVYLPFGLIIFFPVHDPAKLNHAIKLVVSLHSDHSQTSSFSKAFSILKS